VKQLVLASFASALVGGMSGTGLMLWMTRSDPEPLPASPVASAESSAELANRLSAVERALTAVERRAQVVPTALAEADDTPAPAAPSAVDDAPVAVGSPVFEAAVLDIIDRAEEDRDVQRSATRDARKQQRSEHWANELAMRLGLTPAQTETLRTIQAELDSELERERRTSSEGPFVPRDQRRAARQALRQNAEQRLRRSLAPRQQAAYDELDGKLKLYRPQTSD
jgi:hypothetical protein